VPVPWSVNGKKGGKDANLWTLPLHGSAKGDLASIRSGQRTNDTDGTSLSPSGTHFAGDWGALFQPSSLIWATMAPATLGHSWVCLEGENGGKENASKRSQAKVQVCSKKRSVASTFFSKCSKEKCPGNLIQGEQARPKLDLFCILPLV